MEGDAIELAQTISRKLEGKVVSYPPFGTAILFLKDGRRVDFASARSEYYDSPGAPPHVEYSNLRRDLFRRDFPSMPWLLVSGQMIGEIYSTSLGIKRFRK